MSTQPGQSVRERWVERRLARARLALADAEWWEDKLRGLGSPARSARLEERVTKARARVARWEARR